MWPPSPFSSPSSPRPVSSLGISRLFSIVCHDRSRSHLAQGPTLVLGSLDSSVSSAPLVVASDGLGGHSNQTVGVIDGIPDYPALVGQSEPGIALQVFESAADPFEARPSWSSLLGGPLRY